MAANKAEIKFRLSGEAKIVNTRSPADMLTQEETVRKASDLSLFLVIFWVFFLFFFYLLEFFLGEKKEK